MGSKSADIWLTITNAYLSGSIPELSTMQEELGIVANSLGRTAIRLFEESYF